METNIQQLFGFVDKLKRPSTSKPVLRAYEEYDRLVKRLPAADRDKFNHLEHVIRCCKNDQIRAANAQLHAARKEYSEILSAVDDNSQPNYKQPRGNVRSIRARPDIDYTLDSEYMNQKASYRLHKSNPNITDLSDLQRPTIIAERYRELYDNEWTDAYDALHKKCKDEVRIISDLLTIIRNAYHTCKEESEMQLKILEDAVVCVLRHGHLDSKKGHNPDVPQQHSMDRSHLVLYRKAGAALAIPRLQQKCLKSRRDIELPAVKKYVEKCVEACWWMAVQDPPIEMYDEVAQRFDMNMYKPYTVQSDTIAFLVWPALLLQVKGPVLARGVAQGNG